MEEGLPFLPRLLGQMGGQPRPLPLLRLQQHAGSLQPDSLHQSRFHAYQKEVSTIEDSDQERGFYDTENTIENNVDKIKTLERIRTRRIGRFARLSCLGTVGAHMSKRNRRFARHACLVGTSDFDNNYIISMCGIKFWKGNENLRSVYKNVFRNFERFLPFLTFSVLKKVHCPFQETDFLIPHST
jgi:hypothetical protein